MFKLIFKTDLERRQINRNLIETILSDLNDNLDILPFKLRVPCIKYSK